MKQLTFIVLACLFLSGCEKKPDIHNVVVIGVKNQVDYEAQSAWSSTPPHVRIKSKDGRVFTIYKEPTGLQVGDEIAIDINGASVLSFEDR